MGLYDVIAFSHTRSRRAERWRFGAVAFAWSNFLTLGPLAGPAIRFWLYRPTVDDPSDLHAGVVAISTAFTSGLVGWTLAVLLAARDRLPFSAVCAAAFTIVLSLVVGASAFSRRESRDCRCDDLHPSHVLQLSAIGWVDWLLASLAFARLHPRGRLAALGCRSWRARSSSARRSASPASCRAASAAATCSGSRTCRSSEARRGGAPDGLSPHLLRRAVGRRVAAAAGVGDQPRAAPARVARRIVAGLVGGGGVLIMLSSASPALMPRLALLERSIPLPLVETGSFVCGPRGAAAAGAGARPGARLSRRVPHRR